MPMITQEPPAGVIAGLVSAPPGWRVDAYASRGVDVTGIPTPLSVVAWAQIEDTIAPGGARVEPVFVADGRTWTPDQFRAAYGEGLDLKVVPA
jgi:hypothetical protein